jgi:hypothetical protein
MTNQDNKIQVSADEFARYKKLGAEKGAIEREQKAIVVKWEAAGIFPEKTADNVGKPFVVVNGNGDEIGKLTIYACEEKVVAGFIARRIS